MGKDGYTRKGFWGQTIYYDENGDKIGEGWPNFWGGVNHYDKNGNKTGYSTKSFLGGTNHYNKNGKKTGSSRKGFFGQTNHYDKNGNKTGESFPGFFGGTNYYEEGSSCAKTDIDEDYMEIKDTTTNSSKKKNNNKKASESQPEQETASYKRKTEYNPDGSYKLNKNELPRGIYEIGKDIPPGTYDFFVVYGSGSFDIQKFDSNNKIIDGTWHSFWIGLEKSYEKRELIHISCPEGYTIEIEGNVILRIAKSQKVIIEL